VGFALNNITEISKQFMSPSRRNYSKLLIC